MRKVCLFTSTRAEWGLLQNLAERLRSSPDARLQLLVSGTHLSEKHGRTVGEIEAAGFQVDETADILMFDDSRMGICRSMGVAIPSYAECLDRMSPGILVILGDRFEAFCAAAAAQIMAIPVAHIHGGETTEGAVDEAFRHAITKMAHLHFPTCPEYRSRVIQLGESPRNVFDVGSLGIENIRAIRPMTREELGDSIGFALDRPFFLITFHPATLERESAAFQVGQLLEALDAFPDHKQLFTMANADPEGQAINDMLVARSASDPDRSKVVSSLGLHRYLSAMHHCDVVVGNSSSGILEAPVCKVPTVNIGDRQKGRLRVPSIIDCEPDTGAIREALGRALSPAFREKIRDLVHPSDRPGTARRIAEILQTFPLEGILKKSFHDLPVPG